MFATFEPTTLPIAIPGEPRTAPVTDTTSSGAEVPAATMVRPITAGVRRAFSAMAAAKSTRRFPE